MSTSTTPPIAKTLRSYAADLHARLAACDPEGKAPEAGSDAALFLDALCGLPPERYLPRFEASARSLAEQDGHIERRLTSLRGWQATLSQAIDELLATPEERAEAQRFLGELATRVVVALTLAFQQAHARTDTSLRDDARRGTTRLDALQRINSAANSTLDLDQTLATAAQAVAEEMDADLCAIFLFDELTRELALRATNGPLPRAGRRYVLPLGEGYSGWVAEHGHPLVRLDATLDERFATEAGAYAELYRGLLAVPIIFFNGVKLQGVIAVQTHAPREFTKIEEHFLEIVAGQLAMNIENGRLYEQTDEELRRKVHELSTLHHVSSLVTSTLVLDNVLRIIVAQAVLLSGADRSVLFELDAKTQVLRAVASHGFEVSEIKQAIVARGQCCVGRVVLAGEPSAKVDCMRHDEGCFLYRLPQAIGDQHAVLCAPLNTVHGPIGALCVFSSQRHMLDAHQLQLVVTFANVAAIAMENARLFTETRQGLKSKEALLREMHHRVKGNLAQVASIINMRVRRTTNPETQQSLVEVVDRIQGIAATHDLLSANQLGVAAVDDIARKIVGIVRGNLVPPHQTLHFVVGPAPMRVQGDQATTFAIILNELIANAIEHGFEGRERGEIRISATEVNGEAIVRLADDGQPLPAGFSVESSAGLGLQLVRGLAASDLRGAFRVFEVGSNPDLQPATDQITAEGGEAHGGAGSAGGKRRKDGQREEGGALPIGDGTEERHWVVSELRFPLTPVEPAEPGALTREAM